MDERVIQFRVGVVVLAAGLITGILVFVFGTIPNLTSGRYTLHIKFPAAPGVAVDTPVRKSGVPIGKVTKVELLDEGGVLLTLRIEDRYRLRLNEKPRIGVASLVTGDASLEFIRRNREDLIREFDQLKGNKNGELDDSEDLASQQLLQDGDYLQNGQVTSDPLEVLVNLEDDMSSAFTSIQRAGDNVARTVDNLNGALGNNDEQIRRIVDKTEMALDNFNRTMNSLNEVVGDPELKDKLRRSLDDLPEVFNDARATLAKANETLERFQRVSDAAEANLTNLQGLTEPLGESGPRIVADLQSGAENLNVLLSQLADFSETLGNNDGTIGRLMRDDEFYRKLVRVVDNVEDITVRIQPIMDDVRVFTDKIARDPRQLGVKGALDNRPSGTGFKGLP
ncbi:MAG: MCE family protein [Planctomycetales bacterium]|nr:MCE family protein [Planctomycetales bacterium]